MMGDESSWSSDFDLSFDPKTWDVGPAAGPAPAIIERGHVSRFAMSLGGSGLILALGAAAALLAR
ncbi:hypothetical protein [Sphingomonas crocodyli]|uniref:Uncharacterized protein n=1 Tax=Sphingomonas crocodyli TaxID=1979270 RepID=A0A437LWJ3_9SPHN|nr:hypothetical protein [Sphingomonas crocodyli]RVT89697.1 hypothetical protein EOD43_20150 [Sphingomonas crocodyli]